MELENLNPYLRFASKIQYQNEGNPVYGLDARLFYITEGTAELFLEKQHFSLTPGSLFLCDKKQAYHLKSPNGISLFSINFDFSFQNHRSTQPYAPVPIDNQKDIAPYDPDKILYLENATPFFSSVSSIVEEFSSHRMYAKEKCSALLKGLLIDLIRHNQPACENALEAVRLVTEYIKQHFQDALSNKELAALTGYHEYYLNRLFLQSTGMGMHKYVLSLRLTEAKRLLLNTPLSQAEIAERVGFGSGAHFSAFFKKEANITPSAFRAAFKNQI